MKTFKIIAIICLNLTLSFGQNSVTISDFEILNNTKWEGTLTYIDYQSGKPTDIDTKLQIIIEGNKIQSNIQYTYEPHKNYKSSVSIRKKGTYYGNEKIESNTIDNGTRTIVTSYKGKDNGKKATLYITHIFNDSTYNYSKKVVYKKSNDSLIRNIYKFTKIK